MLIEGQYNYYIVALSFIIAILGSISALNITVKISHAKERMRFFWLCAGAFVMGSGIWSMHFVGMLSFHLHVPIKYDVPLTLFSMLTSVLASFIAFYITMPNTVLWYKMALGGLFMGSGIVTMHYTGMAAMRMPMDIQYDPFYFVISVILALVTSYIALLLFLRFRNQNEARSLKWLSAIIMGFGICSMHYTGMKATLFHGHIDAGMKMNGSMDPFLLYGVTLTVFVILLVSWIAMYFDRKVLEQMAYKDTITGLPNRNAMNRFFEDYAENHKVGVLFLDLDQFKTINDTLGHNFGDKLIQSAGDRLQSFIYEKQQVFRIGGDEFLITIADCSPKQAEMTAQSILQKIKEPYYIEGNELYVTGSMGISIDFLRGNDRSILLKNADTAMYKAKGLGKNQYCVYDEVMGRQVVRRMELEKDLKKALKHNEFFILYQPKWNIKTNSLYGFEALLRWKHPILGVISPNEFIPMAEETGIIVPLTRWTLKEACQQCKTWQKKNIHQPISVNLSNRLFQTDSLLEMVQSALSQADLDPQMLELEITESMVLYNLNDIVRQLEAIRSLGVRISMDDFGTGYSSIGLIDRLPIDALKLDRLFINDLETPSKKAIINAIILMAETLRLDVIAEGIEHQNNIHSLVELGCSVMQGFYFGKPMNTDEIEAWIDQKEEGIDIG